MTSGITVREAAEQATQQAAADIKEVPAPAFGRAVELLRDFDQCAISTDDYRAEPNPTRIRNCAQNARRNPSDNRKRDDTVEFAKKNVRDERMRGSRLVDFAGRCRPKEPGDQRNSDHSPNRGSHR